MAEIFSTPPVENTSPGLAHTEGLESLSLLLTTPPPPLHILHVVFASVAPEAGSEQCEEAAGGDEF